MQLVNQFSHKSFIGLDYIKYSKQFDPVPHLRRIWKQLNKRKALFTATPRVRVNTKFETLFILESFFVATFKKNTLYRQLLAAKISDPAKLFNSL